MNKICQKRGPRTGLPCIISYPHHTHHTLDLAEEWTDTTEIARRGDWIQTYTLKQFWPLDPRAEDVDIQDIAHALSMQCRFSGHVHTFYSVAEHCVRVSEESERRAIALGATPAVVLVHARWGLLHDAPEAYLVDLPRPVKRTPEMEAYRSAEQAVMSVIARRFGLHGDTEPGLVKEVDEELCYTEARDLFPGVHPEWKWHRPPLGFRIRPMGQDVAKAAFLNRFRSLFGA